MKDTQSTRSTLVNLRVKAELSQEVVAERAGISRSHYTLIENGKRSPSLDVALRIASVLECNVEDIFFATQTSRKMLPPSRMIRRV